MSMRNRMHRLPLFVAAALAGCSPANDGADAAAPDGSALVDGGCLAMSCDAGGAGDLGGPDGPVDRVTLADGWKLASSADVSDDGATVASAGYATDGWSPIRVPATVLAGLVQNGIHADLYYSDTLQRIDATPFARAWWYRTEFTLPPDHDDQRSVWLHLDGINYRADIWLNGHRIAGADDVVGTFRQFEFDITQWVHAGAANALAVEVAPPDLANDLTLTWVDWNPAPPDRGMGIWRDVYLTRSGPVALRHPAVATKLDLPSLQTAHLAVSAELTNTSAASVVVEVGGAIDDGAISFTQTITLAPSESKRVSFDEAQVPKLRLDHPKLWWPRDLGAPDRHRLVVTARVDNVVSDTQAIHFGIRQVSSQLTASGGRLFQINGTPLFVRGGAWAPDMLLRPNGKQMEAHLRYANDIGLNAIRLEGKLVGDDLFDMLDANGLVAIVGWNCCDRWQDWPKWTAADHAIATASLRDQLVRLRNHPSVIDFLIGSDLAPPADVEKEFLAVVDDTRWPNVVSSSAASTTTPLLGGSGFKMTGPYDWVAPSYWTLDTTRGGAYGFNTETSPGPAIPTLESLKQMLSPADLDALWQQPDAKQFHAGLRQFDNLAIFDAALRARYGAPTSLADYVMKAQAMNYEAERAMFEAYGRNKYAPATGVVQWMLNNAWPSLIWHLFDYYLAPGGAYFGAKKGNELLHIQYSYDDRSIVVVNHGALRRSGLTATARIYNLDGSQKYSSSAAVDSLPDSAQRAFMLPAPSGLSPVYFVELTLTNGGGEPLSTNVYWLSTTAETLDFAHGDWYHTPTATFADFSALATLPTVALGASATSATSGGRGTVNVTLHNGASAPAFFVTLRLTRGAGGKELLPILWSDNDITLAPGEQRTLTASYDVADLQGAAPAVEVGGGWNVAPQTLASF